MNKEYKDYTIKQFKPGNRKDDYGNTWCNMALEGVGEPVTIVVKDPEAYRDGMTIYGEISRQTAKSSGREYLRFYRKQKEDGQQNFNTSTPASKNSNVDWAKKDAEIRGQWAIREAIQVNMTANTLDMADIEKTAIKLFNMVDRVAEQRNKAGYNKAKEVADNLKSKVDEVHDPEESPTDEFGNADINLDDIPF